MTLSRLVLLAAVTSAFVHAQSVDRAATQEQPTAVIRATTRLVQVSVVVQDKKGNPVVGLTNDDFTLFDDHVPQSIAVFAQAGGPRTSSPPKALSPNVYSNRADDNRVPGDVTVVLLDILNTPMENQAYARGQVASLLARLQPQDHVAIYVLATKLYILHDFTQDMGELIAALKYYKGRPLGGIGAGTDAANFLNGITPPPNPEGTPAPPAARTAGAQAVQMLKDFIDSTTRKQQDLASVNRVGATTSAIEAIANHLAPVPGRKNLVWVSGSFPLFVGPNLPSRKTATEDMRNFGLQLERTARALNRANLAVYPVDARGLMVSADLDLSNPTRGSPVPGKMGEVPEIPRENETTGFAAMDTLAERTGGRSFRNSNDLTAAVRRALADGELSYRLAFYPSHGKWDGKYHSLKVMVNRPGVQLTYRTGYVATPDPDENETERRVEMAQAVDSPIESANLSLSAEVFPPETGGPRVVGLSLTLDVREVAFRNMAEAQNCLLDFWFVQKDSRGRQLEGEEKRAEFNLTEQNSESVSRSGLVVTHKVNLAEDAKVLKIVVRDRASGQMGSLSIPLQPSEPGTEPSISEGGGGMQAQVLRLDLTRKILPGRQRNLDAAERERRQSLIAAGKLSVLDLEAPVKATDEFNQASALLKGRQTQEAMVHLRKAIRAYPKFVTAHNYLGMAYQETDDIAHARAEYDTAAQLDGTFAASFVNLGRLELSLNNYVAAKAYLEKAAGLRSTDAGILTALAYAQHGDHQYLEALKTARRIHSISHDGEGIAHYLAASAAVSLNDYPAAQREYAFFLQEDPANPLAAAAQSNLDILRKCQQAIAAQQSKQGVPNSDLLKEQLAEGVEEPGGAPAITSGQLTTVAESGGVPSVAETTRTPGATSEFTIRKVVDEVAVFFGVTRGGQSVTGLTLSDITVRDDNRPPAKVLQFTPQSKLPLRIGLLIDTSESVEQRFFFEKRVAGMFLQQMLSNDDDLGFVIGFSGQPRVATDFTEDQVKLAYGIDQLKNGGSTALFDAVSYACWKLAAYPESERVAKVLVVLSDGEENSSHISLRQTIRDMEASGVTVYTVSTKEGRGVATDADNVLQRLADRSGGEAFFPGDLSTLSKSFDRLRDEIRSRYLIAYRPADFEPNGKYRTITITADKEGKRLQVHARKGYHARVETATP